MKKELVAVIAVVASCLSIAWAGHFTDILPPASATGCVPVSNGYDYNCTTDAGAPPLVSSGTFVLSPVSLLTIQNSTPTYSGQIAACSNCVSTGICISTATNRFAWSAISSTSTLAWPQPCK